MHRRTKALAIAREVKKRVAERDSIDGWPCCVWCGKPAPTANPLAYSNAHFIPRSQGGLGVEKNILTLCPDCHRAYDHSGDRQMLQEFFRRYLVQEYGEITDDDITYRREKC